MNRYNLKLRFDGESFHGWQIQPNERTVQGELNRAIEKVFSEKITTFGCSRTDAGVHALEFFCHFDSEIFIDPERVPFALNSYLDPKIRVLGCETVDFSFHARHSVEKKEYRYYAYYSRVSDPFLDKKMLCIHEDLDFLYMNEIAKGFVGTHDFSAFMAKGSPQESTVRTVFDFSVNKKDNIYEFSVIGNGFLYNSVRIMCGTIIDIARGKISMSVKEIFESNDRKNAGKTLPPDGLYLYSVLYR